MSKRNFILLVIVLLIIFSAFFGYLYLNRATPNIPTENDTGTNFISKFNPFNRNNGTSGTSDNQNGDSSSSVEIPLGGGVQKLMKVSSVPVAGFGVFSKERLKEIPVPPPVSDTGTETTPVVIKSKTSTKPTAPPTEFAPALRYVDRGLGIIYETFVDKLAETPISKTTIPRVYEAFFSADANTVVMRYLKANNRTIETFVGKIPKEVLGADNPPIEKLEGSFLPENIRDLSLSPTRSGIFYLFDSGAGVVGNTMNFVDSKKVQVFDSPFSEWLSFWSSAKTITLTTKPASGVPGYVYALDPDKKTFLQTTGNINGLTTLGAPDGKMLLTADDNLSLSIYHKDTGISTPTSLRTVPDKCVWTKASDFIYCAVPKIIDNGSYPDAWYQGIVSFNDQIWKIDSKTGFGNILVDPIEVSGGEEFDGIKLSLNAAADYLFFVNKKDSFLWEFNLK